MLKYSDDTTEKRVFPGKFVKFMEIKKLNERKMLIRITFISEKLPEVEHTLSESKIPLNNGKHYWGEK